MNRSDQKLMSRAASALFVGGAALFWQAAGPGLDGALIGRAEARIGRPATPMSYAGVARRTTRRTVAAGAAAAGAGYYYAAPGCIQAVNSYGQIVYRCP